jgi:MFS family permease
MTSEPKTPAPFANWYSLGRSLAHRNYRLFFIGQGISLIGTWMTQVATGWLVYRLSTSHSALLLGLVSFAGQVPVFFFTPFAGVLVDRWQRHRLLLATQTLSLIQSASLAAVAFTAEPGFGTIWLIAGLNLFQGVVNAFDVPVRQAFFVEMIDRREDLANAIALNSSLVNGARLVGPSIAGVLIALVGEGWCFTLDAISYVAVLIALLAMRLAPRDRIIHEHHVWHGLKEGFKYTFGFAPIRVILLHVALVSFVGVPYSVLMPIFADEVLNGGPYALGFLTGSAGVGALTGALYLAARRSVLGLGRAIVVATALFGIGLMLFSVSRTLWLSIPLVMLSGLGMMVQMASCNTILQTIVDEDKRGRVMSFYSMAFLGVMPFGSLFAGSVAAAIGAPYTVRIGGAACLLAAVAFALQIGRLRPLIRPIYMRMGILESAAAAETESQMPGPLQK